MLRILRASVFTLIGFASVGMAHADVVINFMPSTLAIAPGGTIEFTGTLTNNGADDVFLNGDFVLLPFPDLTVDDSPFFANSPLSLAPGASYNGPFIDVTADLTILSGVYDGSYTVQGGVDSNAFDNLAVEDFSVDVGSAASVPEPNYYPVSAAGLLLIVALTRRRSKSILS